MIEAPLRLVFSGPGLGITLVTALAFGRAAGRIPARKATRVSTPEALT